MTDPGIKRVQDYIRLAATRPVYTNFLGEAELAEYENALKREKNIEYMVLGGYEGAVRAIIAIYPAHECPESEGLPIRCLRIEDKKGGGLSHRDYLGALMALGVKRELVGDIVADESGAYVFCTGIMERLICDELTKVGSHGVAVYPAKGDKVAAKPPEELKKNVSSMRLDCIIAAAINKNRELTKALIEGGAVTLNGEECKKISRVVCEGDVFSIKGRGKYRVGKQLGKSAKDRIFVELYKY